MFRVALSMLVGLCLLAGGGSAQAGGKKDKDKPVHGIVQKVDKNEGKDSVFLVVEVMNKKKDDSASTEKQEKRFEILSTTKIEKVSGKKDNVTRTDMKLEDLKPGQRVIVTTTSGKVEKVEIMLDKKKK